MNVCVHGLWHLGSVTAACVAAAGHEVRGLDPDSKTVSGLRAGKAPIMEPGLDALLSAGINEGRLHFYSDPKEAIPGCQVIWIAFDTPVDADDNADVRYVTERIKEVLPFADPETMVLISSQLPIGTCRKLEMEWAAENPRRPLGFACSPENLRLGKALEVFRNPDRVIVGARSHSDREVLKGLLTPITTRIEWMSVESAEMTKHALNAFLAVSVTYANEIASLCEKVGADAKEVERGLKSESRIGRDAYLSPGAAFAGGTLARDVEFLNGIGSETHVRMPLLEAVRTSNESHRGWPKRKLEELVGHIAGKTICVWGLTYKPGTDTLRRSSSIELCHWLVERGATVRAHDPAVARLPVELASVQVCATAEDAARGADALVVMTAWPEYRQAAIQSVVLGMKSRNIVDPARILAGLTAEIPGVRYCAVGMPHAAGPA